MFLIPCIYPERSLNTEQCKQAFVWRAVWRSIVFDQQL